MIIDKCHDDDKKVIVDNLVAYNISKVPAEQDDFFIDISKKVVDNNEIVAGIIAKIYCWNIIHVDVLWVSTEYRGKKLGSALLDAIEREARKHNAHLIHLDTFDFQAKAFYEKKGYEVFGVLEDCPAKHCRYYLKKSI